MGKIKEIISRDTAIPISLVAVLLACALSAGAAYSQIDEQGKQIVEMRKEDKELAKTLTSINTRLSTIEGLLKAKQ